MLITSLCCVRESPVAILAIALILANQQVIWVNKNFHAIFII